MKAGEFDDISVSMGAAVEGEGVNRASRGIELSIFLSIRETDGRAIGLLQLHNADVFFFIQRYSLLAIRRD